MSMIRTHLAALLAAGSLVAGCSQPTAPLKADRFTVVPGQVEVAVGDSVLITVVTYAGDRVLRPVDAGVGYLSVDWYTMDSLVIVPGGTRQPIVQVAMTNGTGDSWQFWVHAWGEGNASFAIHFETFHMSCSDPDHCSSSTTVTLSAGDTISVHVHSPAPSQSVQRRAA